MRALASKAEDLSSIPETHLEGENRLLQVVYQLHRTVTCEHTQIHAHTTSNSNNQRKRKKEMRNNNNKKSLSLVSRAVIKHHDEKQLNEKRS